jgi:hypothetical protein
MYKFTLNDAFILYFAREMFRPYLSNGSKANIVPSVSYTRSYVIFHRCSIILATDRFVKKKTLSLALVAIDNDFLCFCVGHVLSVH